jgi:hypothetical protein
MKLERFNAWLSFAGNIAILTGLVALAIEISDNTAAVRAQELGAVWEQTQTRQLATLEPAFGELYQKSLYSPEELSLAELVRLVPYFSHHLSNLARLNQAYLDGIVRESDWSLELIDVPIYFGSDFGQAVWAELRADYVSRPDFVQAIDDALRTSPIVPDDDWYLNLQSRIQSTGQ